MPEDIRIRFGFPDHPKTKRLISEIGIAGIGHLILLWEYIARTAPKGKIKGMTDKYLAEICRWSGDPKVFSETLIRHNWISKKHCNEDEYIIFVNGWKSNQGWIYFSKERSNLARKSIEYRWKQELKNITKRNTKRNTFRNTPSPSPFPSPSPSTKELKSKPVPIVQTEAVATYRDIFHLTPTRVQQEAINHAVIGDGENTKWRETCHDWALHNWSPKNVAGMLERFTNGGKGPVAQLGSKLERSLAAIQQVADEGKQNGE